MNNDDKLKQHLQMANIRPKSGQLISSLVHHGGSGQGLPKGPGPARATPPKGQGPTPPKGPGFQHLPPTRMVYGPVTQQAFQQFVKGINGVGQAFQQLLQSVVKNVSGMSMGSSGKVGGSISEDWILIDSIPGTGSGPLPSEQAGNLTRGKGRRGKSPWDRRGSGKSRRDNRSLNRTQLVQVLRKLEREDGLLKTPISGASTASIEAAILQVRDRRRFEAREARKVQSRRDRISRALDKIWEWEQSLMADRQYTESWEEDPLAL